ncbi:MAG: transcriptional repressor [Polyangiaceae bacterium]|nr:transcriptional repressor [Polyangiaceae bacterium]
MSQAIDRRERLRKVGLKATTPRLAVLRVLDEAVGPLAHADVVAALDGDGIDRATVYRNLTDLTDAGLAHRSDLGDHVWRFRVSSVVEPDAAHPHFVCNACGEVVCLPAETVRFNPPRGAPRALRAGAVAVQVRGVCDKCRRPLGPRG